jgi:dihydroorotate dehydrogenase (NAD+) catalytic subunit
VMNPDLDLGSDLGAIKLRTPLIGSSGLFGYGNEYEGLVDLSAFGAVIAKTVTLEPREGNPPPRLADCGSGVLNSIGLENAGCDAFLAEKLPAPAFPCKFFASIGGETIADYGELAAKLDRARGIDAIEVNVSCPNVARGGLAFGADAGAARAVVAAVRASTRLPVIAKLPPLVTGIEDVARAACDGGADALTVANTYPGMAIDLETEKPALGAITGGYSGRAVMPMSLLLVWKVTACLRTPVIASGGIERAEDAIQYILAGASAFQVGSVILRELDAPARIVRGIETFMKRKGYRTLDDFRGRARGG